MARFARQIFLTVTPNLQRIGNPEFMRRDPCLNCSLPFCSDRSKECSFLVKPSGRRAIERDRQELIEELKSEGVILGIRGNGFIEWADDTETDAMRVRRQKREYMRRVRGQGYIK